MVIFSHLDAGTSEEDWQSDERIRSVPPLDSCIDDLLVVASHPDDETLGAGGLIRRVHDGGGRVTVVVATDGEASHPNSMSHSLTDLGSIRRLEVTRAVHALDPEAEVHFLGLPDGALREHAEVLVAALLDIVDSRSHTVGAHLIVAPWSGDGHRDHRVTAECVSRVSAARGLRHMGYPIWLWHWGRPDDVPWSSATILALTPGERSIKARALRTHTSQMQRLSDAAGDEAIISPSMRAHFERDTELYFAEPRSDEHDGQHETVPANWFESFYARHADPWGFQTRWYEQRKRALLMASLPSRHLGSVLEIGCSTGLITDELAERAAHVLAIDISAAAVDAARKRIGPRPDVTVSRGAVPEHWPAGVFDTVVLSEVGYYLSRDDLERTLELLKAALAEDGCVLACHWRHAVAEHPLTGDEVHAALRAVEAWDTLVHHEEEDFVLEVFTRRPAVSVARREGLD
jgi:LmbE family N-acetylglucosaminyl deacetylase